MIEFYSLKIPTDQYNLCILAREKLTQKTYIILI